MLNWKGKMTEVLGVRTLDLEQRLLIRTAIQLL